MADKLTIIEQFAVENNLTELRFALRYNKTTVEKCVALLKLYRQRRFDNKSVTYEINNLIQQLTV